MCARARGVCVYEYVCVYVCVCAHARGLHVIRPCENLYSRLIPSNAFEASGRHPI